VDSVRSVLSNLIAWFASNGDIQRIVNLDDWRRNMYTILIVILVLALLGVLPTWPHSRSWGYRPSGVVGLILIVLLILFLMGRL